MNFRWVKGSRVEVGSPDHPHSGQRHTLFRDDEAFIKLIITNRGESAWCYADHPVGRDNLFFITKKEANYMLKHPQEWLMELKL